MSCSVACTHTARRTRVKKRLKGIHLVGTIVAWCSVSLLVPLTAHSAPGPLKYRCNGKLQARPCTVYTPRAPLASSARARFAEKLPPADTQDSRDVVFSRGEFFARVLQQSFSRVTARDGLWKGRVEGNGLVHLELQIFRNGSFESRRYMGNVKLANKSTGFSFRSVVPGGGNWTWKILAFPS